MPLLIQNGRIITSTDDYTSAVYFAGKPLTRIEKSIETTSVLLMLTTIQVRTPCRPLRSLRQLDLIALLLY